METLYGLKRKKTNRWLKLLLLLFVAVGFGIPNLNAQTKAIKVANDQQLIEAMGNDAIGTIELEAGYYTYINYAAASGTKIVKKVDGNGNRVGACTYYIIDGDICFDPAPPETFVQNVAVAGTADPDGCGCCPLVPDQGVWTVVAQPTGSVLNFLLPTNFQVMPFEVNMPGAYTLRYTWPAPFNSLVETEYFFFGPPILELSAPDVCGTSTWVTFVLGSEYPDPETTVEWTLNGLPYAGPDTTSQFLLEVDPCGLYELCVVVTPAECPPDSACITIDFACQPIADAGPDVNVCGEYCYYSLVGSYGGVLLSPTHAWSWIQLSGPSTLVFEQPDSLVTSVCGTPECPYGEYEVEFQVQNGECYDSDSMLLRFYQMPTANAGFDQNICADLCFSLQAVPFQYCGEAGINYWKHSWWELVSQPDNCAVIFDTLDPTSNVCITDCDPDSCAYGPYVFVWHELNVKVLVEQGIVIDTLWADTNCYATDTVIITIYESPEISAGEDMIFCNTFAFTLYGIGDEPCYENTVVVYSWEKSQQPGNCTITFFDDDILEPWVEITDCDPDSCEYGDYIFTLTQSNGYYDETGEFVEVCSTTDSVKVTIFEDPIADAGDDYFACVDIANSPYILTMNGNMDYCFSMYGIWAKSCGPGEVVFDYLYSPVTVVTFPEPGRYVFTWTLWNEACEDVDTVLFDLLEQPTAFAEDANHTAPCDDLCYSLLYAGVQKYQYFGTDQGECPNFWDNAHWVYISGPCEDPAEVTFAPDNTHFDAELCVSHYGGYTIGWVEINQPPDKDYYCSDTALVFIEFYETPEPFAGDDEEICGNCYTLLGVPYTYLPPCNQHLNDFYYWTALPGNPCEVTFSDTTAAQPQVCIPDDPYYTCYGTYGFVLHESNGDCFGTDTVYITFNKIPDPVPLCFYNDPNDCGPFNFFNFPERETDFTYNGCIQPNEVIEVCAEGCTTFYLDYWCVQDCWPGFDPFNPAFYGWTFEWSVTGPAGTTIDAEPGWYDFENGWWNYPWLQVCWGECCDTARIYLTITTPEGCENTMEYKAYVHHKPCVDVVGPEVAEVGDTYQYCNNCPPNPCLLYTWEVVHCGVIESGQGTACIDVHWTDYNVNGGWGMVVLTVLDTCTGCCNTDTLMVKVWPSGTLGDSTLYGHVYYQNNYLTPLNGVEIQLWNAGIPVQTTESFNDIEGGNGEGYYEFPGVSGVTNFGITATYDGPWYGANATDALAVELKVIAALPGGFLLNPLVEEAMDVNNGGTISATDALWIKQRAINMVTYFPAGDWVWNPGMDTTASEYDIMTLNAGDANRSNIPASGKEAPAIALVSDGTMNVVTGQEFALPIRIADANQFGAITLILGYNSALIEVVDVIPVDGMLVNISNGNVRIAWSNVNPMVLAENDVVVTLKVKAISPFAATESLFSIGLGSEFADATASVIAPVTLKTFGITTEPAAEDYFLSANRPNPFSNSTFIEYTMPETGKVKLSVLDMLGQEIAVLVNSTQTAGSYTVEFSAAGLSTGVYIYKITVDGETRDFISTQRMVISH